MSSLRFKWSISGAAGLASSLLPMATVSAQGYVQTQQHQQQVCHVEVKTEPEYRVFTKAVVKEAGRWEIKDHPAVYGEVTKKVLVKAGEWETKVTPAIYEDRERQVLVKPEHVIVRVTPAVFKTEKVEKKTLDRTGKEQVVYVEQQMLIEPAKKHVEKQPAVYKAEAFRILTKPEHRERIYHQPVYHDKVEKVLVKAASQEKIYHKPVVEKVEEKVQVKPAGVIKKVVYKPHGQPC